jgi:hypothetical protein
MGSAVEEAPVTYRLLADLVVVVHLAFLVFVALGAILAWRWPRLVWVHVPVLMWAVAIVAIGFTCPLTPLEKLLRRRAGGETYDGGFVDHYLEGVVYPGRYLVAARAVVLVLVVVGYAGLVRRARSDHRVGRVVEPGDHGRPERPVGPLRDVRVDDLDVPQADHVERESVVTRGLVERRHPDVLEVQLQEGERLGARFEHLEPHVVDPRAPRARVEEPR